MSTDTDSLVEILKPFGLSDDESRIFIHLLEHGPKTALSLSRALKIGRTKVYRILEDLEKLYLVHTQTESHGREFEASSIENLRLIVEQKEGDAKELKTSLSQVLKRFSLISNEDSSKSKVLHYTGNKGLKQVIWNQRTARDDIRTFVSPQMSEYIDFGIGDEVRLEFLKNKVAILELRNETCIPAWTNVTEIVTSLWKAYYIPKEEITIDFELSLYNDVIALYGKEGDSIFCVEIHNAKSTELMKKMFDFIMKHSEPMTVINDHGEAVLK